MSTGSLSTFYYDKQLKKYQEQFCALFAGLQVEGALDRDTGVRKMIVVPVSYGSRDRVVAAIQGIDTQNALLKVPAIACYMSGIALAPNRRKGTTNVREVAYMPQGGFFPSDIRVMEQMIPVPYTVTMDVYIMASSQEQQNQILEQILILFDPVVQIQKSDAPFDMTKITTAELINISLNETYPQGSERRAIQSQLSFTMDVYLSAPAMVRQDYIKRVLMRIGATQNLEDPEQVIADLDAQGAVYEVVDQVDNQS